MSVSSRDLLIFGVGGMGRETALHVERGVRDPKSGLRQPGSVAFVVDDAYWQPGQVMGMDVLARSSVRFEDHDVIVAVGDSSARASIVGELPGSTGFPTLLEQSVACHSSVSLGAGSFVCGGAILTCDIEIGPFALLNIHASVSHDNSVGAFFTASPGARLLGGCTIGDRVFLGAGALVRPGVRIADDVTVGMGAVVVDDLDEPGTYVGNPARLLHSSGRP